MPSDRILVGEIGRPHGVRGLVRVQSFTADPADISTYGPLTDQDGGIVYALEWLGGGLAKIAGVTDRDVAAKLTGTRLYLPREKLPQPEEEEFYLADLVGMAVRDTAGEALGQVRSVEDFGAGSFLTVVDDQGRETLLPFTKAVVPVVDVTTGHLVVNPPEAIAAAPDALGSEASAEADEASALADPGKPLPRRQDLPRRQGPRGVRGGAA